MDYYYLPAGSSSCHPDEEGLFPLRGTIGTDPDGAGPIVVLLARSPDHVHGHDDNALVLLLVVDVVVVVVVIRLARITEQ